MTKNSRKLKKGNLIRYNFLYSNEEEKVGVVFDIIKDINFTAMVHIVGGKELDIVPLNIMEFTILD
jgi:hypothetical protein